ncbi:MAG: hypothetical protein ACTMIR_13710 [Cellulomonadaceae bacterium]
MRDAIDQSLPADVPPQLAALLDTRIAETDSRPVEAVPWEIVRDRARAKVAAAIESA